LIETISISKGNKKLKNISSFSLPPVASCLFHTYCSDKCYAKKAYRAYPNTKNAYDRNFRVAKENLENLKKQLMEYLRSYNGDYFRIHVSGDYYSQEYLNMWIEVCKENPNIHFMSFTKCYTFDYDGKPDNMEVIFSTFDSMPSGTSDKIRNKYNKPIAHAGDSNPDESYYNNCADDCSQCKICWNLSENNRGVFFHYH
jgi:hypothetical protein